MSSLEEGDDMARLRDWRKALRSPPSYRIVNNTLRNQKQFISIVAGTGLIVLLVLYSIPKKQLSSESSTSPIGYNYTYPLSPPLRSGGLHTFRIGIIADLDTNSKSASEKSTWFSYFKKGYLSYNPNKNSIVVSWDKSSPTKLTTSFSLKDRGMELSELVVFDGRLLTFDDRTGLVFEIIGDTVIPWVLLMDGDGKNSKGFKSEWATVKNEYLFVGSMGKEWTTASGDFQHNNPQYLKKISRDGRVEHLNWISQFKRIREVMNIYWPGYMIHESGAWSSHHQRWFFLPRRCSQESYNETLDEIKGCSVLISADKDVYDVKMVKLPNKSKTRGFSTFKFVPGTNDRIIVALRTEEIEGKTATYITAFDIEANILLDDTFVSDLKYEGLEFV